MAYNWRAFLRFAQLNANSRSETVQRIAASRTYYAAFNLCRDWLEAHGHTVPNQAAHGAVWGAFRSARAADPATLSKWRLIAAHGAWLRALRNAADYDDEVPGLPARLGQAIERAELILDELLPALRAN